MDSINKNTVALCAVGDKYVKTLLENLHRLNSNLWDIHILTDQPEQFTEHTTYRYTNVVFSYFDKLLFTFRILKQQKQNTFSLDVDKLYLLAESFTTSLHNYDEFRYYSINRWAPYFNHLQENGNWKIIYKYFKYLDMDTNSIRNFWEEVLYFPFNIFSNRQINIDIETLKPIFEHRTILDGWSRPCLGEGEGIALGFLINKYHLEHKEFDCEVFPNNNPFNGKEQLI